MMGELSKLGIKVFDFEPEGITNDLAKEIFGTAARVISYETSKYLSGKTEGDWIRPGSEGWFQIARVKTGLFSTQTVAMKSLVSLGDIHDKVLEEATRLALLGTQFAPEIFAVTRASLIKEFLPQDHYSIDARDMLRQLEEINEQLGLYGLWIQGGYLALREHTIQNSGRRKLIDAGTGDISGTASF